MESEPLYPFGYGLSFTSFEYSNLTVNREELSTADDDDIIVGVDVENTGNRAGDEVVQLYIKDLEASVRVPFWQLNGVERIHLNPGEKTRVEFTLKKRQFALIDEEGKALLEPGKFRIYVGGQQPDERSKQLTGKEVLYTDIEYTGETIEMEY